MLLVITHTHYPGKQSLALERQHHGSNAIINRKDWWRVNQPGSWWEKNTEGEKYYLPA